MEPWDIVHVVLACVCAAPVAIAVARWIDRYDRACDEELGAVSSGYLTRLRREEMSARGDLS